jgi:hypothetical protein
MVGGWWLTFELKLTSFIFKRLTWLTNGSCGIVVNQEDENEAIATGSSNSTSQPTNNHKIKKTK